MPDPHATLTIFSLGNYNLLSIRLWKKGHRTIELIGGTMSLIFGRKKSPESEVFDPNPGSTDLMPARPYRVLHADLPFCSDPECRSTVEGARLVVLCSEDPRQRHQVRECMPTRKKYQSGQLVEWGLNNKKIWQSGWYVNPETGAIEKAWTQAVEFAGSVVTAAQAKAPQ